MQTDEFSTTLNSSLFQALLIAHVQSRWKLKANPPRLIRDSQRIKIGARAAWKIDESGFWRRRVIDSCSIDGDPSTARCCGCKRGYSSFRCIARFFASTGSLFFSPLPRDRSGYIVEEAAIKAVYIALVDLQSRLQRDFERATSLETNISNIHVYTLQRTTDISNTYLSLWRGLNTETIAVIKTTISWFFIEYFSDSSDLFVQSESTKVFVQYKSYTIFHSFNFSHTSFVFQSSTVLSSFRHCFPTSVSLRRNLYIFIL